MPRRLLSRHIGRGLSRELGGGLCGGLSRGIYVSQHEKIKKNNAHNTHGRSVYHCFHTICEPTYKDFRKG